MDKVSDSQASAIESVKALGDQLAQQESQLEDKQAEQEQNLADTQASVSDYEAAVAQAQSYYNGLDSQVQQALAAEAAAAKVAVAQTSTGTTTTTATTNSGVSTVVDTVETTKETDKAASSVSDSESGSYDASSSSSIVANAAQFIGWPYKWGCYGTNMTASVVADFLVSQVLGVSPVITLHFASDLPHIDYLLVVLIGVYCGLLGSIHNKGMFFCQSLYERIDKHLPYARLAVPFALSGVIAFTFPQLMTPMFSA